MTRKSLGAAVLAVIVVATAWFAYQRYGEQASTQPLQKQEPAATAPVVSVKTEPLTRESVRDNIQVYGEVASASIEAINFPRSGQVSQLLVIQGQRVGRGTPLATLASDPSVRLAYEQARSAVRFARGELDRNRELLALQLATRSQVDSAQKSLEDAQATLVAEQRLGGDFLFDTVKAPFDGVVIALSVAQGDRVAPGATVLQLGHADRLRVRFGIEPADEGRVKAGMPVLVEPVSGAGRSISATIDQKEDLIDPRTQLIDASAFLPPKSAEFLVPGMKVRGSIVVDEREAWTVPRQAVLSDEQGAYIFQVVKDRARRVMVTKGTEHGDRIAIEGKLDPALPVVTLGNYELKDGADVKTGGI